jgi:hypothetical protein
MFAFTIMALVMANGGNAFGFRNFTRRLRPQNEQFSNKAEVESWSKPASRKSSPLQVRKRVRAVLQKAKTRTGVDIKSEANIVAEAASIGGFGENILIEVKDPNANAKQQPPTNRNGLSESATVFADENMVVTKKRNGEPNNIVPERKTKPQEFDVVRGDMPAANEFCEPLPFELPKLKKEQLEKLRNGERVQEQARMGREGSGYVVLDVKAPPYVVWECLLDFESYPQTIPTVRDMQLYTSKKLNTGYVNEKPVLPGTGRETRHYGAASITRAKFILSKFRLNIAAIHKYIPHPDGDYMIFTLDKSCTNMVLKGAKGIWYTEQNPDGREVRSNMP